jgi:ketosteroid isomerase-like protein
MKHLRWALMILVAAVCSRAVAETEEPPPLEVRTVGSELVKAVEQGNTAALERLLAKDYVAIDIHGTAIDKRQRLQQFQDAGLSFESVGSEQQSVRAFGNTAIVTGIYNVKGVANGKPIDGQYRYLDVWVKRDGQWQAVATTMTPLAAPAAEQAQQSGDAGEAAGGKEEK